MVNNTTVCEHTSIYSIYVVCGIIVGAKVIQLPKIIVLQ